MNHLASIPLYILLTTQCLAMDFSIAPSTTAAMINKNYNEQIQSCVDKTGAQRGHYYCTGVIVRTLDTGRFNPWDYSPLAVALGSTSYSWIRQDTPSNRLYHPAGFVIRAPEDAVANQLPPLDVGWLCIYSFDADTTRALRDKSGQSGTPRGWNGCDFESDAQEDPSNQKQMQPNVNQANAYGSCAEVGVSAAANPADAWIKRYGAGGVTMQRNQCSWNVESNSDWRTLIGIHIFKGTWAASGWTELLLKNSSATNDGSKLTPYIDAFVYDVNRGSELNADNQAPLTLAMIFQQKLRQAGYLVPVLRMNLAPGFTGARFAYDANDQGGCDKYIESATWNQPVESGIPQGAWRLSVTPTPCGRAIKANETDVAYAELANAHGQDPQWLERNGGGMRRQFVCLLVKYRDKPEWNLEPFRPNVTQAVAEASGCNPVP
jgi:hypothetical protein